MTPAKRGAALLLTRSKNAGATRAVLKEKKLNLTPTQFLPGETIGPYIILHAVSASKDSKLRKDKKYKVRCTRCLDVRTVLHNTLGRAQKGNRQGCLKCASAPLYSIQGQRFTAGQVAQVFGINRGTFTGRLRIGMTPEDAALVANVDAWIRKKKKGTKKK